MKRFFKSLYLPTRLFLALGAVMVLFVLAYFFPALSGVARLCYYLLLGLWVLDLLSLYGVRHGLHVRRLHSDRFSNGDANPVELVVESRYNIPLKLEIVDEIPHQFQRRDISFRTPLKRGDQKQIHYALRPVKRGVFNFGVINGFVRTPLGLVIRRYQFDQKADVAVYPSYIQMRKFELLAIHNNLTDVGVKKIRRIGHNQEFEQIKDYVQGDDIRTINWKATARRGHLMVNSYQDEKAQQVYAVIDKGRAMKMPFEGMTLLDYAINAALVISNIAIQKSDRAGLITFEHRDDTLIPASKRNMQMQLLMEALYKQETSFQESDFARLYSRVQYKLNQRSLLLLFTNFESYASLDRQLPYLRKLAKRHVLVVIFFENTELRSLLGRPSKNLREIYTRTIGEKFAYEKRLIVKELQTHGIYSVLTAPENLTVNTINKYLELKSRGII